MTPQNASQLHKNIVSDRGLGQHVVTEFLQSVLGVNANTIG